MTEASRGKRRKSPRMGGRRFAELSPGRMPGRESWSLPSLIKEDTLEEESPGCPLPGRGQDCGPKGRMDINPVGSSAEEKEMVQWGVEGTGRCSQMSPSPSYSAQSWAHIPP